MTTTNRKWWILFTMCLLTVMLNFDATAVNLAIPKIAWKFHANLASMQWVINGFVLFGALLQIVGGRLGDMYGHRRIFIIGTIMFIAFSVIAGVAYSEGVLIFARMGQGVALGIAYPMSIALTYAAFPREQHGVAMGFIMGTMGIWLGIGPTLGGVIIHYLGWRWIFYVNVPIGIFTIILTYIFCRPVQEIKKRHTLDYVGAAFLMLGLLGVIVALNESQQWGVNSSVFIVTMVIGVSSLVILYFWEKRQQHPIVNFSLFKQRNFLLNNLIRIIAQLVFIPVLFFIPIYLQNILGYTPLFAGAIMLYLTVIIALLALFAGKIVDKIGVRIPNALAMISFAVGCIFLYEISPTAHLAFLATGLIFIGIGTGISSVSTTVGALSPITMKQMGMATGILMTIIWVSCAIGVALMGLILAFSGKAMLLSEITIKQLALTPSQTNELIRIAQGMAPLATLPELTHIATNAFMHGFRVGILVLMLLSILGLMLTLPLKKVN